MPDRSRNTQKSGSDPSCPSPVRTVYHRRPGPWTEDLPFYLERSPLSDRDSFQGRVGNRSYFTLCTPTRRPTFPRGPRGSGPVRGPCTESCFRSRRVLRCRRDRCGDVVLPQVLSSLQFPPPTGTPYRVKTKEGGRDLGIARRIRGARTTKYPFCPYYYYQ